MSDNLAKNNRILIVGAGNLATCLGIAFLEVGIVPIAIWSRSEISASTLAERLGCLYSTDIDSLPDADIVITAVCDDALCSVAEKLVVRYSDSLLVHTAGSVNIDVWADVKAKRYGVFYPMQTFSKSKNVDFSRLGIFVEGNSETEYVLLEKLAALLTPMVYRATSEQRRYLHIAAVYACNFVNAMYSMSADLLAKHGLPFEVMLPLIDETAAKIHDLSPCEAQTGPACRGDKNIMKRQRSMLDGIEGEVYDLVSRYISKMADIKNEHTKKL